MSELPENINVDYDGEVKTYESPIGEGYVTVAPGLPRSFSRRSDTTYLFMTDGYEIVGDTDEVDEAVVTLQLKQTESIIGSKLHVLKATTIKS